MEKKSIYNKIAMDIREDASALLAHIHQCKTYNAITEKEARELRSLVYQFYQLSYELERK